MHDQTMTKSDLNDLEERLDKRFDDLTALMSQFANDVSKHFTDQDEELRKMNSKYDHLINTIDGFVGRIDRYETELAARDHKIERLERWMEQLAMKNGLKLEY